MKIMPLAGHESTTDPKGSIYVIAQGTDFITIQESIFSLFTDHMTSITGLTGSQKWAVYAGCSVKNETSYVAIALRSPPFEIKILIKLVLQHTNLKDSS
jgi:hypothetical protein